MNEYLTDKDLEVGKVYKLGSYFVRPRKDKNGNLWFNDNIGVWGGQQYFLKSDLKKIQRVEKYDKLTEKELSFLSNKEFCNK